MGLNVETGEFIDLQFEDAVAVLTLNRPDSLNALHPPLMRNLVDVLQQLADEDAVRCVVLTGAGKGFCAGGDVRAIKKAADDRVKAPEGGQAQNASGETVTTEQRSRWLRRSAEASRLLHEMPKPTIAMINGACAGAGMSLAAACDLRYAAETAVFRPSFLSNGVSGDYGGSWLWTKILGTAKARQLYYFDEKRFAADALEFGLVDAVYPDVELRHEVLAKAKQLAALPGAGLAYAKINLNAALSEDFASHLDRESRGMMLSRDVLVELRRRAKESA